MSRSNSSPSLVMMTRRCAGAGSGVGVGGVSAGGCAGASVGFVAALSRVVLRLGVRVLRRRGVGVGVGVGVAAAVSSEGLASVLSVGDGVGCAALSLGRALGGAGRVPLPRRVVLALRPFVRSGVGVGAGVGSVLAVSAVGVG